MEPVCALDHVSRIIAGRDAVKRLSADFDDRTLKQVFSVRLSRKAHDQEIAYYTNCNLRVCASQDHAYQDRSRELIVRLSDDGRLENVLEPDPPQEVRPDPIGDGVDDGRAGMIRIDMNAQRTLAERHVDDIGDGVRSAGIGA
jgi:hypothetical protein